MTTYEDLTPYTHLPVEDETRPLVNVGWLGPEAEFAVGDTPPGLVEALLELAAFHSTHATRSFDSCRLCGPRPPGTWREPLFVPFERASRGEVVLGNAEIHVPAAVGVVYAAPTLVCHYVERHHYRPPAEFAQAVLAEAAARTRAWEEIKRSLPVGTSARGEIDGYSVEGLSFELDGLPDPEATVPFDLYGPDGVGVDFDHVDLDRVEFGVPVDAVVVGHAERGRRVVLRVEAAGTSAPGAAVAVSPGAKVARDVVVSRRPR